MGRRYSGAQTTKGRSAFDLSQGFLTVAKPELGTKRLCASCSAKFYDLNHDPITCPKCGAVHEVAPIPQRGGRPDVPARRVAKQAELPETQEAEFISLEDSNEHPPVLKAEQRGWIKERNDCWKSDDKRQCIEQSYKLRIAELQARYRLVQATKPVSYVCDGQPAKEVIATFFQTEPPTAIAEFGDQTSLMYQQLAASGTKYHGRNETLWEHQGEARITWGYGSPEMHCRVQR